LSATRRHPCWYRGDGFDLSYWLLMATHTLVWPGCIPDVGGQMISLSALINGREISYLTLC
jgi:hypothetical protein